MWLHGAAAGVVAGARGEDTAAGSANFDQAERPAHAAAHAAARTAVRAAVPVHAGLLSVLAVPAVDFANGAIVVPAQSVDLSGMRLPTELERFGNAPPIHG